jgi:hypothetical protein
MDHDTETCTANELNDAAPQAGMSAVSELHPQPLIQWKSNRWSIQTWPA